MEWKRLGRVSKAGSLVASAIEGKKLGSILMGRWKTMFVSGFAFAFLVCSIFLAFSHTSKVAINPILIQRRAWFHSMFSSRSPNSSVSFFTFIFANSDETASAKPVQEGSSPDGESSRKIPDGDQPNSALKQNVVGEKKPRSRSRKKGISKREQGIQGSNTNSTVAHGLKNNGNTEATAIPVSNQKNNTVTEIFNSTSANAEGGQAGVSPTVVSMNGTQRTGSMPEKALKASPSVPNRGDQNGTIAGSMGPNMEDPKPPEAYSEHAGPVSAKGNKQCNIFNGRWVHDESYPYYPAGSCPHIDESFDCFRNMRPDHEYEKWRWQPNDCSIPRLNTSDMLERLRGKRLVFVGDSLNRNMWESLVCILRHGVRDKKRVHETSGRHEFRKEGFYAFRYEDYNCSVEFVRAPFLVEEWEMPAGNGTMKETLRLDLIESSAPKYREADVIVFNTGHWWSHEKTSLGKDYYQEGDYVYPELNVLDAFRKALQTWGRWVDDNIDPTRTLVFFRGYSASHFSGGQWNSGGQCHTESQPIFNDSYLTKYPSKMDVLESVMEEIKTPVIYLNITRLSDYRKDGHPSIYRKQYLSQEERMAPEKFQDCSHWCLPGIPDTWNELLYASLLQSGRGVWGK